SILVSIAAGRLVRRAECEAAVAAVRLAAGPGPAIVAGAAVDERVGAEARVAIVATRGRLPEPPSPGVAEPAPPPRPRSLDDMFVLARPRPRRRR
ncbi:MAG TPA: hypothetical protein VOB72_23305, partial [Candidatus Dormibacteraeota bacterium]|nr:hypothetical protein [Candidatus Dormibacteraeota bacterium]